MEETPYERIPVYDPNPEPDHVRRFRAASGNAQFRRTWLTAVALLALVVIYPAVSIAFAEDPSIALKGLNDTMRILMLLVTIVIQWGLFVVLVLAAESEKTGLAGLGFRRFRPVDLAWAVAFLLAANLLLSGLAWVLGQIGLPMSGDIRFLIPTDLVGRIVWVVVAITAGVVEETAFRGYLMTRLRLLGRTRGWLMPTVVSALVFGSLHAYQGAPGVIVIAVYGALFSLLYIRTGTLWPAVIAHFFQDLSALFFPQ
ncbi:MAG TPA: type II CAAX endopeptidase family protein [candidate division Zixibacteria bacterium]|nr:CPBP family intramembrane metalloprotease [candidate division Zixibacteria bacterium]MDD4916301.1 type II CAAX endopeptidase family protein [candidate division Zixibacteria bacterium]MDM7973682.1 type II CAAX endopeptidase family protein [candidate division Zixibacteria bacterium]HOD65718.1 type II CAAX endopeptidase family protein [candidate division Zixibacteria bacterium]HOZ08899.1 type II CAAX endopeptidase family protein [candidate division Zixibacteria bacterium]